MSVSRQTIVAWAFGALCALCALSIAGAIAAPTANAAADSSGAMPGDDALTCEQIFQQGMAESQKDQQARSQRNAELKAQGQATGALVTGAMLTGGMGGTGQVAQAAVEAGADRQMTMLTPPPPNVRMQHLKQLYAQKRCGPATPAAAADAPAIRAGDEAMTCEQIAAELAPYAQQMMPNIQALGSTDQQLYAQGREMQQRRRAEDAALTPLADAGAIDPTGASKRAYEMALMAQMAKRQAENEAFTNSPLAQENRAQSAQLAAQGQQMQANGRVQRLMQLGQAKRCDKR
jgi:hypothetical protein